MNISNSIHIFKPGQHTAMSGARLNFSESDLAASAKAYDPALHEAPLVIGHPKADAPAYGWVKSLAFADSGLHAAPDQIDPAFAELLSAGRFKKVSASFYTPDAPSNPVPGVYYLRHVGFLGAQPPAIKGLKQAEFADNEEGTIEFSEWDDVQNASLWRNLREFFIAKFGLEEADKTIPNDAVQLLEQSAQDELREEAAESTGANNDLPANYQEHKPNPGETMSVEEKARLAELEAENARLKKEQADFAEGQRNQEKIAKHLAHTAFAEGLIKDGKLLPNQKDVTVAVLDFMAGQEDVVEFGEGSAKQPLIDAFKADVLAKLPKQIEFGEIGTGAAGNAHVLDFADPEQLASAATQFQAQQAAIGITVDDIAAINHVRSAHVQK